MPSEEPTHEEIQACIRRAHQARSLRAAEVILRGIDATGRVITRPLTLGATAAAVVIGGVFVQADTGPSSTSPLTFAATCVAREAALITTAESRYDGETTAALAQAGLKLMTARNQCHEGRVKEAVALYDELIRQAAALPQNRETSAAE